MKEPTKEQQRWLWEQIADEVEHFSQDRYRHYRFGEKWVGDEPPLDLNNLFKYAVPKSKMDTLWVINNLGSPTPSIEYCFGFTRGKDNDVICWSKTLPVESCLSPICKDPALAIFWAICQALGDKE